jgi:peptide deformylase
VAIRPIVLLGDPVLRGRALVVTAFDAGLKTLAADMLDTMYAAPGRGLAAPQVGVPLRLFVMDIGWKEGAPDPQVFVNPRLTDASDVLVPYTEGCLSIPGQTSRVARPDRVALHWQDLDGTAHDGWFDGFAAVCVQHERDHLDGILCIDLPVVPDTVPE